MDRFSAEEHGPQAFQLAVTAVCRALHQRIERAGRAVNHRDALPFDRLRHVLIIVQARLEQHQPSAGYQCGIQIFLRQIEAG
ncbi:hypothetical protein D3C73_839110 [compost metagenome]